MSAGISGLRLRQKAERQTSVQVESTDAGRGGREFQSAQRTASCNRKDIKNKKD